MARAGCLAALLLIGLLAVELWGYLVVSEWMGRRFSSWIGTGYVEAAILIAVMAIVGVRIARHHITRLPMAFMAGMMAGRSDAGRHLIGAIGGVLIAIPGFFTDVIGILLVLPPVQRLLAGFGQRVMGGVVRQTMGRMMGGKFPGGFPGGMPGGLGGFPGMKPDEAMRFPGMTPRVPRPPQGPKTYDTTVEKDGDDKQ